MDARSMTCPVTFGLFRDPVILRDGNTYERSAILKLLEEKGGVANCPLNPAMRVAGKNDMLPNHSMKSMVAEFMWKNPRHELVREAIKEKNAADLEKGQQIMESAVESLKQASKLGNTDAKGLLAELKKMAKKRKAE